MCKFILFIYFRSIGKERTSFINVVYIIKKVIFVEKSVKTIFKEYMHYFDYFSKIYTGDHTDYYNLIIDKSITRVKLQKFFEMHLILIIF